MWRLLLVIAACLLALTGCPMQITTIEELQLIGNDPAYPLDGDYELANDIDASDTETWNAGAGFAPIGSDITPFTGDFDGAGYAIGGLCIVKTSPDNIDGGLFAYNDGQIHDLMLTDASVLGGDPHLTGSQGGLHMACLCAVNRGTIERCGIETSTVRGYIAGLLVGQATPESVIQNCYATGRVYGTSPVRIGGLVGENAGLIEYCYAAAIIDPGPFHDPDPAPEEPLSLAGGLVGANGTIEENEYINYGIVRDSYYDYEVAEVTDTDKGDPKTTAEMKSQTTFVGWDFDEVWGIGAEINDGYPYLLPEPARMAVSPVDFVTGGEANSIAFNITTTAEWAVASDSAWAVVSPATGSGNATITVACTANTGDARDAIITVTGVYTDPEFIEVAVTQVAFAEPEIFPPPPLQPANLPASSVASVYYDEYVTLYRQSRLNDENEPEYTPYTLLCRLDRKTHRITDGSGLQVTCSHVMLCDTEIDPVTDYIVTAALDKLIPKEVIEHKDFAAQHYEVWLV